MENKICSICGKNKLISEFYINKSSGKPISHCNLCKKEYNKKYRDKNKEKLSKQKNKWYINNKTNIQTKRKKKYLKNKENIKSKSREYHSNNKERVKEYKRQYYINNKEKILNRNNKNLKLRKKIDPVFKLKVNIRTKIYNDLKKGGFNKNNKTNKILGCSFEEFKQHIESLWQPWMNWDNYGLYNGELNYGWDIDHITPISSATNESEVIKLNHYTNLQPLCSKFNRDIKRGNII
jgi:hypothetical protein